MKLRKLTAWFLILAIVGLSPFMASAYVMVTLQANGLTSSSFSALAYTTGIGTNTGNFTVSRSGTLSAVTINLAVSGTAMMGVDYVAFPTNITLAANVASSNLTVALKSGVTISTPKTVVLSVMTNTAYYSGLNTNAVITLIPTSDVTNSVISPVGRYWRGSGSDPTYWSQVVPLNYETGILYSNLNGNTLSLYGISAWLGSTFYHYNATNTLSQTNTANRIPFNNPIVAFGERVGGTPLYLNQPYSFGVCVGAPVYPGPDMLLAVFNRSNLSLAGYIVLYPPSTGTKQWTNYVANGFQVTKSTNYLSDGVTVTTNTFGLATTITTSPNTSFGSTYGGGYVLTHTANSQATNYYYLMQSSGYANPTNPMVIDSTKALNYSILYTLEFETRPPWRSVFLDQPHFDGSPLPPFYAGKSVAEIMTNTPPVTNVVTIVPSAATALDDSPELRRHPMLDNFVASMNNDPIALANYVINQIDLTDPMDFSDNGNVQEQAINPAGVSRGALGTFLEKQGSPVEECALLVYLLRQAGVPAVYEFPPRDGVQILDSRLSRMLKFQVQGGFTSGGQLYTTNTMIPVNYPWVAAYIGTNWVHIFPWMKDYQMAEGLNLWDEMPTNYPNAYLWLHDYLFNTTNLTSLAVGGDETPRVVFPKFIQQTLLKNHPGISLDDIGMQTTSRQHYYSRWQDFPTPTWVTNTSMSLESLTDPNLSNISPTLTNIFDTVSVEIYSQTNPAEDIQTGDMRLCDLHNREFYINQFTNGSNVQLNLILMPFRPGATNQSAFSNDTNLLSKELLSLTLVSTDDSLGIRFHYHRHRALSAAYAVDPFSAFLGLEAEDEADFERPLRKGDQAAICMNYGRVTPEMLNVHAADIWQMENALRTNSAFTNSVSPDVYQGATIYLAGMSYYQKSDEFNQQNQNLHKIVNLSTWAAGLSKMEPARNSSGGLLNGKIDPVLPAVDMFNYQIAWVGNGTARPDSGQDEAWAGQNYNIIAIANDSAEEHQVINRFYGQTNAVSTVRLLQLAQTKGMSIVQLNISNYVAQGGTSYQGHALNSYDPSMWQQTTNLFGGSAGNYGFAYMTPGPITNAVYKGMGSLIVGYSQQAALISPSTLNGGFGENLNLGTFSPVNLNNFDLADFNGNFSMTLNQPATGLLLPSSFADNDYLSIYSLLLGNGYTLDNYNTLWSSSAGSQYGLSSGTPNQTFASTFQFTLQSGDLGSPNDSGSTWFTRISDPVHTITGEFYDDETDLQLPGPLPLALSRHYSSQNLADNQFGRGWKLNIMPYLVVTTNSTNIFAAEMDGSVIAYVQTTTNLNVWLPTLAINPQLNNDSVAGTGGLANRLRNRIVQAVSGSITNYTLYGADGSIRAFQTMTFNNGVLNQTRPYLQQWTDNRGNYYTFTYGTDSTQPNFGQVTRVQCSNGIFLGFDYDIYNHIVDAYTGDGRWLYYDYNEYGDLTTVTLPDNTTRSYQYLLGTQAVTNGTAFYSTHLLIEEDKPDGRELINTYDSQRRVTNQLSTAGTDLNPIRTARFIFSNNFNITNSYTKPVSGFTLIVDGNNHTNRYDYTNNLITKITDPLGQTIQQVWYADNATAPGYPRSVATKTNKRGLVTQYQYDTIGNVTNMVFTGDLTGDGISSQTATNIALYNSNNLPVQITDAVGNSTVIVYDPIFTFLPQQVIKYAGSLPVSTNFTFYGSATNMVLNGSLTQTNMAFGLATRQIRAFGSADACTNDLIYDGHGFISQSVRYTGTTDPNVTNIFFYNERGDQVSTMDSSGAETFSDYDALDRQIESDNFDEFGNSLASSFYYYNDNGEIDWIDGPRYNPEDYIFYDYDGAGRMTTEIHWLSEAKNDGSGVEAQSGYNLYAQTFYQYDPLGNVTLKVDPRGAMTTNIYNPLCQLVQSKHLDTDGLTILSTEGYAYEPGGQVHYYTNGLGGVTTKLYTINGQSEFQGNPDGSTNGWRYYLDGRAKRQIQANGAYWQTTYDDFNRITTRIFYSAAGVPLATNSTRLDRRGNAIQKVDAGGNIFTTTFDGLDRAKATAGPAIVTVSEAGSMPNSGIYVTNILQQSSTNFYDAAGRVLTNINALGETLVAKSDAIGRQVSKQVYSSAGTLVHQDYTEYSRDHNSVTVTNGSGTTAIVATTFSDTENHPVLILQYPSPTVREETFEQYDMSGNHFYEEHDSYPFNPNDWHGWLATFDGLNRLINKYTYDNAYTTYAYDALGDLTNRTMPGNLQWLATYNNAGQMLQEKYVGTGNISTRTNKYVYFSNGNPFAGHLQTKTDGRGVSCAYAYDDWLRQTNMVYSGSLPEQNLTTTWQYEPRGFVTGITEQFANTNTGSTTKIQRAFDPYGQLSFESVSAGSFGYSSGQSWDAAGRRTLLGIAGQNYSFGWQADGSLTFASNPTGSGIYSYDTAGLLTNRLVVGRSTGIVRDGEGRPLTITTTVNASPQVTESLSWGGDGVLASDTLARADFTDSRSYSYAYLSRRLIQERLNINGSKTWTNTMVYDNGVGGGMGALTQMGQAGGASNEWNGVTDAFTRVATETNNTLQYAAYGHVNGQATLTAWLDGQPAPVTGIGTNAMQWRAMVELTPGAHQLKVAAAHPSGFYTAYATNSFTNSIASQSTADGYDSAGNITNRVWKSPNGTVDRTQTLSWDARGRLHQVMERDASNSGYNWSAVYDALNRRLQTTTVLVSNGVASTAPPQSINQFYDPQVEFLELGVSYGLQTVWKLYGPDLNGAYGGQNGTGGFDGFSPYVNIFTPVISDSHGNVLAEVTNGVVAWNSARTTGYGAVPGYRPVALANGADIAQSSAWRGHWVDITGYYQIGLRPYNPVSGSWLTYDSVWNDRDLNSYSFVAGDPISRFDSDGRMAKFYYNTGGMQNNTLGELGNYLNNYQSSSSILNWLTGATGTLLNEAAVGGAPSTYVNGLLGFGNNVGTIYNDSGLLPATSYAISGWNVGQIVSGVDNLNLVTGEQVGDWWQRGTVISGGVASTATIVTFGTGVFNWGTSSLTSDSTLLNQGVAQYSEPIGPPSLATQPNQAYFWSGLGRGGDVTAAQIAGENGGVTLEMQLNSLGVQMPIWDVSSAQSVASWQSASTFFAQGASGDVNVILGGSLRPGNIWQTFELPALQANENVTSIFQIDPATGQRTTIWQQ